MNSLGIFHDVKLKNYNNIKSSLKRVCDHTSNLVDYMDNYQRPTSINKNYKSININNNINNKRRKNQSVISRIGRNIIIDNNSTKLKKKSSEYYNNIKINKYKKLKNKIFGNNNVNNYSYKQKNESFNYNKEYENELIDQIENLFHPSENTIKNNYKIENIKNLMPNNYMDIYSLMGKEFELLENQIDNCYKKNL